MNREPSDILFDTARIMDADGADFRTRLYLLPELIEMLDSGKLRFAPGQPWGMPRRQEEFIQGLLMGLPPSTLVLDGSSSEWYVIEGAEYLKAYADFYHGKFTVNLYPVWGQSVGKTTYESLPLKFKSRFLNTKIIASVLTPGVSTFQRLWIYRTAIHKAGSKKSIWNLLPFLFPKESESLNRMTKAYHANDSRTFWDCVLCFLINPKVEHSEHKYLMLDWDIIEIISIPLEGQLDSIPPAVFEKTATFSNALSKEVKRLRLINNFMALCYIGVRIMFFRQHMEIDSTRCFNEFRKIWPLQLARISSRTFGEFITLTQNIYTTINDTLNRT